MSPTWREIWDRRRLDPSHGSTLAQLMAADGLDTGFGSVTETAWRAFVDHVACTLDLRAGTRVFEVGCGAGAFLYPLYESGCTVAGLDQSAALVSYAAQAMPRDGSPSARRPRSIPPSRMTSSCRAASSSTSHRSTTHARCSNG